MTSEKELMIKFQMFEKQIKQTQQQLQAVEQAIIDMGTLVLGLDELRGSLDKEILAPMGKGIFAKTKLISEDLIVDVGGQIFVKKNIPETKKMINEQVKKLEEIKEDLEKTMEEINSEVTNAMIETQKEKQCCGKHEKCECNEEDCNCD